MSSSISDLVREPGYDPATGHFVTWHANYSELTLSDAIEQLIDQINPWPNCTALRFDCVADGLSYFAWVRSLGYRCFRADWDCSHSNARGRMFHDVSISVCILDSYSRPKEKPAWPKSVN